jgi:hypothetical protein
MGGERKMPRRPVQFLWVLLPLALSLLAGAAAQQSDAPDVVSAQLHESRERYAAAAAAADAALLKAFERQVVAALNNGDVDASRRLEVLRAKFKGSGRLDAKDLPAPLKRARQEWVAARGRAAENLGAGIDRAIRGYTRARQLDRVDALRRERDEVLRQNGSADGLVLRLSFEPQTVTSNGEQSKVKDLSGSGNDGVQRGSVKAAKDGAVGSAASFDGRGGDVLCGNGETLQLSGALTLAAFVRPASHSGTVIGKDDWRDGDHARGFVLRILDDKPDVAVGDGSRAGWHRATSPTPLSRGRWYHLAATFDGKQLTLYVDGKEAATDAFEGKVEPSPFPLVIARGPYDRARIFTGDIDEVTVFDRALSPDEVRDLARRK